MHDEVMFHPDGYVLVRNRRVTTVAHARGVCAAIDTALRGAGCKVVLFDTRDTEPPPEDVRTTMWEWVQAEAHHDRCAIVVKSEMTRVRGNMTARSLKARLRSFDDVERGLGANPLKT